MNNDAERPLTFQERQQLFNAQLNLAAPKNAPVPRRSPRLPPRHSVTNGSVPVPATSEPLATSPMPATSPVPPPVLPARNSIVRETSPIPPSLPSRNSLVEDTAPDLPPRRSSLCVEPGQDVCEEPRPFVHVSQRKNTRKAVRVKKSPTISRGSISDRSPSPSSDPLTKSSPSTIRRAPARSAPEPPSPRSETLKKSPSTIKRAPPISGGGPPPINTPPPRSPDTIKRAQSSSPSTTKRAPPSSPAPISHRQSLPASQMMLPPDLPARRLSYDERLEVDARALQSKLQGLNPYHYARPTGPPPPKPPNQSPFSIKQMPKSLTMKKARDLRNSSIYNINEPPAINLSTHPKCQDLSPSRNSRSSPSPSGRFLILVHWSARVWHCLKKSSVIC